MRGLIVLLSLSSGVMLSGCDGSSAPATSSDVNNHAFAFASGQVFDSALANSQTILAFSDNGADFVLSSIGGTATGTDTLGPCVLTVTTSNYAVGTGPQVNEVMTLNPCTFDSNTNELTVTDGSLTATSAADAPSSNVNPAAANMVNDQAFIFANGGVFDPALATVQTTLAFSNNASDFELSSVDGAATGTDTFGPLYLSVR
jgi:hypothetical protein